MKIKFLIAEEFRQETNNKIAALGVFPGDVVVLLKQAQVAKAVAQGSAPIALERLAFLVTVSELGGTHNFKGEILDPKGEKSKEGTRQLGESITIQPGMTHSIVVESKPFVITEPGMYKFVFYVDETPYEFPFEIRNQP